MTSSRRSFLSGLATSLGAVGTGLRSVRAQTAGTEGTPVPPTFELVATVESEVWMTLATASATPIAAEELAGPNLLAAMRGGGFVIYFRHARTDFSQDDTDLSDLSNCAAQRNLSDEGREQAHRIGEAITALNIPIGDVLSSQLCRTRETAELAFGRATLTPDLTSFGTAGSEVEEQRRVEALRRLLSAPPRAGTNTVLVAHLFNIQRAASVNLAEGEAGIFRPLGEPRAHATPTN